MRRSITFIVVLAIIVVVIVAAFLSAWNEQPIVGKVTAVRGDTCLVDGELASTLVTVSVGDTVIVQQLKRPGVGWAYYVVAVEP